MAECSYEGEDRRLTENKQCLSPELELALERTISGVLGSRDGAKDVMQEVQIKILRSSKLRNGEVQNREAFCRKIAVRCAIDKLRKDGRRRSMEVCEADLPPPALSDGDASNSLERFAKYSNDLRAIELSISARQMEKLGIFTPTELPIWHCMLDDMGAPEISVALGLERATVRQHMHNIRQKVDELRHRSR